MLNSNTLSTHSEVCVPPIECLSPRENKFTTKTRPFGYILIAGRHCFLILSCNSHAKRHSPYLEKRRGTNYLQRKTSSIAYHIIRRAVSSFSNYCRKFSIINFTKFSAWTFWLPGCWYLYLAKRIVHSAAISSCLALSVKYKQAMLDTWGLSAKMEHHVLRKNIQIQDSSYDLKDTFRMVLHQSKIKDQRLKENDGTYMDQDWRWLI